MTLHHIWCNLAPIGPRMTLKKVPARFYLTPTGGNPVRDWTFFRVMREPIGARLHHI